jgi:hypothetical protein
MPGSTVSDEAEIALSKADAAEAEAKPAADDENEDALVDDDEEEEEEVDDNSVDAKAAEDDEFSVEDRGKDKAFKPPGPADELERKNADAAVNGRSAVAADAGNAPFSANQSESEPEVSSIRDGDTSSGEANAPSARAQTSTPSRVAVDVNDGDKVGSQSDCKTKRNRSG